MTASIHDLMTDAPQVFDCSRRLFARKALASAGQLGVGELPWPAPHLVGARRPPVRGQATGLMSWFIRNRLAGSYFVFSFASRSVVSAYLVDEAPDGLVIVVVVRPGLGTVQPELGRTIPVDVFARELRHHQVWLLAGELRDLRGDTLGQTVGVRVPPSLETAPFAVGLDVRLVVDPARLDPRYRFAPTVRSRQDDRPRALLDQDQIGRRLSAA